MRFSSKTELILFIIHIFSRSETFWSAFFISLKLHLEGFLLVSIWAFLVFWNKDFSSFFPFTRVGLSYSRCSSPTPSSHVKVYSEDQRWGCGERERNPHILYDEANSLINSEVERSFPSSTISDGHPSRLGLAGWMERSVQEERRTVVQGARSRRTEKKQREVKEEGFFNHLMI